MQTTALTRPDAERRQRFMQVFNRTMAAFPNATADAARMQVYYDAMNDLPIEAIEQAGTWLQRNGGEFFPTAAKWHERGVIERDARVRTGLRTAREEPWKTECPACEDTGWEYCQCNGGPTCGRQRAHAAHQFVVPCPCRPTNRTYQRKIEREKAQRRKA